MYEWDPNKNRLNQAKHGIRFEDAYTVLEDPRSFTIYDDRDDEDRQITIGMDDTGRILVVVYTYRGENIRIISARKASKKEVNNYEGRI